MRSASGRVVREVRQEREAAPAAQIRRRRIEQHERGERTRDSGTCACPASLMPFFATMRSTVAARCGPRRATSPVVATAIGRRLAVEVTSDDVDNLREFVAFVTRTESVRGQLARTRRRHVALARDVIDGRPRNASASTRTSCR